MKITLTSSETPDHFEGFAAITSSACGIMSIVFQITAALGIIIGIGVVLLGVFPLGFAVFVDADTLYMPAFEVSRYYDSTTNGLLHQIFLADLLIGAVTIPFWIILVGRKLMQERTSG